MRHLVLITDDEARLASEEHVEGNNLPSRFRKHISPGHSLLSHIMHWLFSCFSGAQQRVISRFPTRNPWEPTLTQLILNITPFLFGLYHAFFPKSSLILFWIALRNRRRSRRPASQVSKEVIQASHQRWEWLA